MHPILVEFGSFKLYSYGFFAGLDFLVAVAIAKQLGGPMGFPVHRFDRFGLGVLFFGFLGCHLLFVITQPAYFIANPIEILKFWGGRAFIGGVVAVVPFIVWFAKHYRIPFWDLLDITVIGGSFGHVLGRIGCFLAGCCHGHPTDSPLGVRFQSELVEPALRGVPVHPAQLYEAAGAFVLGLLLLRLFRSRRFSGQIGLAFFIGYGVLRSGVELFRGDSDRGYVIEGLLSTSQFISLIAILGASYFWFRIHNQKATKA